MKKICICFIALAGLLSCEQQENKRGVETAQPKQTATEDGSKPKISDKEAIWLNPEYLTADFNGDGYLDTDFTIIINNKKGIRIKHGNTNEEYIIGAGNEFGNGGDDFGWVENWSLITDSMTYNVTFMEEGDIDGSRDVRLDNPAFYIGLWSTMYDAGIRMAARVFIGSYVRDNYPGKLPLLPQCESSKKWGKAHG